MPIESNPHDLSIVYRKHAYYQAKELHDIAEKYNGFFPIHATIEDTYRIGELLEYHKEEIKQFLLKNYPEDKVKRYFNKK